MLSRAILEDQPFVLPPFVLLACMSKLEHNRQRTNEAHIGELPNANALWRVACYFKLKQEHF